MRTALVYLVVAAFAGLGTMDLVAGHLRTGIAAVLLGVANALLLTL